MNKETNKRNITEVEFLRLYLATLVKRGERQMIKPYEIEEALATVYKKPEYASLFQNITKRKSLVNECVDLSNAFKIAYEAETLVKVQHHGEIKSIIGFTDKNVSKELALFPEEAILMNKLCEELQKEKGKFRIAWKGTKFSQFDFLMLLLIMLGKKDEGSAITISKKKLEKDLLPLYDKYSILFQDICPKGGYDNLYVDIDEAYDTALTYGAITAHTNTSDMKMTFYLSEEETEDWLKRFPEEAISSMQDLCKKLRVIMGKTNKSEEHKSSYQKTRQYWRTK